ncbi:MAG: EAL domain-containing protein [Pseudomonadota bacterium]
MNSDKVIFSYNLPYNQDCDYWVGIFIAPDNLMLKEALVKNNGEILSDDLILLYLGKNWNVGWQAATEIILRYDPKKYSQAGLVASGTKPSLQELGFARKSIDAIDKIAASVWLGDALLADKIICYMQPVIDKNGKVFGYEAFARMESESGLIGGWQIIEASRNLNAEYMLDRYLHQKAIKSFIDSDLQGVLFINLILGFIQRPEKYFEGLTEAAKFYGMNSKNIVLDFTNSEMPHDANQVKAIFDYARIHGYSLSLDDISSPEVAKRILGSVNPDFIKLDIKPVRDILAGDNQAIVAEICQIAHNIGANVLAEGVETDAVHEQLLKLGVDLFQGYLFSPPVAIEKLKKAVG